MKAVLCKTLGPARNLVLEDVASPLPKKNEILLDVQAAGVNFPDTLIIEGKYQFQPPLPFSPGGEAAGVVAAVGEKAGAFKVGDRVMALTGWGAFALAGSGAVLQRTADPGEHGLHHRCGIRHDLRHLHARPAPAWPTASR